MEPTEEAFFKHIRAEFEDFEFDYVEGAWERFQEQERKKGLGVWFKWIGPAAAIVILFTGLLFLKNPSGVNQHGYLLKSRNDKAENLDILQKSEARQIPFESQKVKSVPSPMSSEIQLVIHAAEPESPNKPGLVRKDESQENVVPEKVKRLYPKSTPDMSSIAKAKEEENRNWRINVSLSNDYGPTGKLKLGFGSSVTYALNKRISISAGAAYTHVSAFDRLDQPVAAGVENKKLVSVETTVTGIDLPLELRYHISERSYLSLGISAIGILSKAQQLNYVANKLIQITVYDADGPRAESKLVAQSESVPVASGALPQQDYLGFYNFSYGFMQKIGKNNEVVFEPYLKLPMGSYSEQGSKLIATGLRIKVGL